MQHHPCQDCAGVRSLTRLLYNSNMYIIAIAWLYVTLLMALTETSIIAGLLTFIFYGALPLTLVLWLLGTPSRRRRARQAEP